MILISCVYVIFLFTGFRFIGFCVIFVFFFKQKTAYEMRISDWSSDVCSSDLAFLKRSRAKKAITLDLKSAEGRGLFLRLVGTADVVVENFSVGVRSEERRVGKECQYV